MCRWRQYRRPGYQTGLFICENFANPTLGREVDFFVFQLYEELRRDPSTARFVYKTMQGAGFMKLPQHLLPLSWWINV